SQALVDNPSTGPTFMDPPAAIPAESTAGTRTETPTEPSRRGLNARKRVRSGMITPMCAADAVLPSYRLGTYRFRKEAGLRATWGPFLRSVNGDRYLLEHMRGCRNEREHNLSQESRDRIYSNGHGGAYRVSCVCRTRCA